jgi:hypothetical protein
MAEIRLVVQQRGRSLKGGEKDPIISRFTKPAVTNSVTPKGVEHPVIPRPMFPDHSPVTNSVTPKGVEHIQRLGQSLQFDA